MIDDLTYRRILNTIDRLSAIDELAAYRSELRRQYAGDPKLARLEQVLDLRAHDLLSGRP